VSRNKEGHQEKSSKKSNIIIQLKVSNQKISYHNWISAEAAQILSYNGVKQAMPGSIAKSKHFILVEQEDMVTVQSTALKISCDYCKE